MGWGEIHGNTRLSLSVKKSFVIRLDWPLFYPEITKKNFVKRQLKS